MRSTESGYDERAANDLASVVTGRSLFEEDTGWVIRALVGAFRPNRDLPLFILAHFIAVLAVLRHENGRRTLLDDLLDPELSVPSRLERLFEGAAPAIQLTERGLALEWFKEPVGWRTARRCLALAEVLLTADECANFAEISSIIDRISANPVHAVVAEASRALGRIAHAWRRDHVPLASVERQLRKVVRFMKARGRGLSHGPRDQDLLDYYAAEIESRERPMVRSVVELFLTVRRALDQQPIREALQSVSSLDMLLPSEEAQIGLLSELTGELQERAADAIATIPDTPRMLKQVEKDQLYACLSLEPFTTMLPLTVLRVVSFEAVQSGIVNRMRRGSGGPPIEQRVKCAEATKYVDLIDLACDLENRLSTLITIAFGLRVSAGASAEKVQDSRGDELAQAGLAAVKRMRRAGFDSESASLAEAFASAESALIRLYTSLRQHNASNMTLAARLPLPQIFEQDRAFFAKQFERAYSTMRGATDEFFPSEPL